MRKPKVAGLLKRREPQPIKVHVDVHNHGIESKIDRILNLVEAIHCQGERMGVEQDRLRQEVAEMRAEVADSVTRFTTLFEEYKAAVAAGNDAEAKDLADQLDSLAATLKAGTTKPASAKPSH